MLKKLRNFVSGYSLLLIGLIALGLSFSWGPLFFSRSDQKAEGERIFRVFEAKEKSIRTEMDRLATELPSHGKAQELWTNSTREQVDRGLYYAVFGARFVGVLELLAGGFRKWQSAN